MTITNIYNQTQNQNTKQTTNKMVTCTTCTKQFPEHWRLQQHNGTAHGKQIPGPFLCTKCSKHGHPVVFKEAWELGRHLCIHKCGGMRPVNKNISALAKFAQENMALTKWSHKKKPFGKTGVGGGGRKVEKRTVIKTKEVTTMKNGVVHVSYEEEKITTLHKPVVKVEKVKETMTGSLVLSIDVSGSTAGRGHREILEGIDMTLKCVEERKQPQDVLGVYAFDSTVKLVLPFRKATTVDATELKAKIVPGGLTALMDGIGQPLVNMQTHHDELVAKLKKSGKKLQPRFHELMVLTDGAENASSKFNENSVRQLLQQSKVPNLHVTLIYVASCDNKAEDERALRSLRAVAQGVGKNKVEVVAFKAAKGNIKKAFAQFITTFTKRVSFEKTVERELTTEQFTEKVHKKNQKLLTNGPKYPSSSSNGSSCVKYKAKGPKNGGGGGSKSGGAYSGKPCHICKKTGHLAKNCFFKPKTGHQHESKAPSSSYFSAFTNKNKKKNVSFKTDNQLCAHCGKKRSSGDAFCKWCGKRH